MEADAEDPESWEKTSEWRIEHGVAEGQVRTYQCINSLRLLNMAYKRGRHP